jgi:hypothetical protein
VTVGRTRHLTRLSVLLVLLAAACSGGASVSIASPEDGATVESPFQVAMGADGFTVEPAGEVREGAGHLHLMVDSDCLASGETIPEDASHLHFGDGSTETELDLSPGEHALCLQAGDGQHAALDLTDQITITVVEPGGTAPDTETEAIGEEEWEGTYTGTVVWDCGPIGEREGTLDGTYTILVDPDETATMEGDNTVTGSCAGPESGELTTPITVTGSRTSPGFEFPSNSRLWGPTGTLTITLSGTRGTGRLTGPAPGPATVTLDFETTCRSCSYPDRS